MVTIREAVARLISFFRKDQGDREFDEELAAHIEMATADHIRDGLTPPEARRRALARRSRLGARVDERRQERLVGGVAALAGIFAVLGPARARTHAREAPPRGLYEGRGRRLPGPGQRRRVHGRRALRQRRRRRLLGRVAEARRHCALDGPFLAIALAGAAKDRDQLAVGTAADGGKESGGARLLRGA